MAANYNDKGPAPGSVVDVEHVDLSHVESSAEQKVHDGDEALQVLHTHFEPYTKEEEKKVLHKIDRRMILLMLVVNGIQFVDKQTISSAAIYGIITQAKLRGQEYSLLISIFYIGYLVAQYPSSVLMQRFPTGKYITVNFILWGATLAASAAATNFATLAAARFFLGVFEACVTPGFVLVTSSWWRREEQTARIGLWYCANGLIGAPSGLLFFGIAHITKTSLFPYQWMFLICGLATVVFGIGMWWTLPDSPVTVSWLNERERLIAIERLKDNKTGVKNKHHKKAQVLEALTDPKCWMLALGIFFHNMTNSLQTNFSGLIIKGFGYDTYDAVLLTIPGGIIFAAVMIMVSFFLATKLGEGKRILFIIICYIPGIACCLILHLSPIRPDTKGVHLFAVFILSITAVSAGTLYSLLASNVAGYTKKTVAGTMYFITSSVANIVGPQAFLSKQAPTYSTGIAVTLTAYCCNVILFSALYVVYYRTNKARDREAAGTERDADKEMIEAFSDLTDLQNKAMRYKM